ncbi:carotenoid cleavage dioxygenase, partial [Haematococcus lacustris]
LAARRGHKCRAIAEPTVQQGSWVSPRARAALFGPAREQVAEQEAVVTGSLPDWLQGSVIGNGGGLYSDMEHLFDGLALISKLRIQGGRVW